MNTGKKKAKLFKKRIPVPTTEKSESGQTKLRTTYRIPPKFEVDMIWDGRILRYEWTPDVPNSRTTNKKFWKAYTSARDDFYTDVAALEGIKIAIFDGIGQKPSTIEVPTKN
jgi:hypothetical protein